ncbi:hypothetical protein EDB87DRAFT_1632484 [Lactarius vividus]|nr:hypothetical protein EDB87DRAFT_1632484 [Lactarius vividus]
MVTSGYLYVSVLCLTPHFSLWVTAFLAHSGPQDSGWDHLCHTNFEVHLFVAPLIRLPVQWTLEVQEWHPSSIMARKYPRVQLSTVVHVTQAVDSPSSSPSLVPGTRAESVEVQQGLTQKVPFPSD